MNRAGGEIGMNCDKVTMVRFLTTGRWCARRGAKTKSGGGSYFEVEM